MNCEQVVTRHFEERKKWGEVRILIQMRTDVATLQLPLAYAREIVNGFLRRFIENYLNDCGTGSYCARILARIGHRYSSVT